MRFSSIFFAIDSGSNHEPALKRAIALARSAGAALTVGEVVDKVPRTYMRTITAVTPKEVMDAVVADKYERIRKMLRSVNTANVDIRTVVLTGKPYAEISRQVEEHGHDLVIKSVANRPKSQSRSITRADRDLLRHCPCLVWLVNADNRAGNSSIVAAIDKPAEGSADEALNRRVLEVARSIALAEFRELHVVHVWQLPGESHLRGRGGPAVALEADRLSVREMTRRMDWLNRVANEAENDSHSAAIEYLDAKLHAIKGNPVTAVPELADKVGASLIVMGNKARTGVPGVLIGNTAEKVLARSDCSFLIVKEPDPAAAKGLEGQSADEVVELQRMQA